MTWSALRLPEKDPKEAEAWRSYRPQVLPRYGGLGNPSRYGSHIFGEAITYHMHGLLVAGRLDDWLFFNNHSAGLEADGTSRTCFGPPATGISTVDKRVLQPSQPQQGTLTTRRLQSKPPC